MATAAPFFICTMFGKRINTLYKGIDKLDKEAGKFALSIAIFSSNLSNVIGYSRRISSQLYLAYMRMIIDACTDVKAALVVANKPKYYKHYLSGKETRAFKIGDQYLTNNYLLQLLEEDYEGITEIYKYCCKWVHPTNFQIVRLGKYRNKGEEYIGYRGRTYTKMKPELKDIKADFEQCQLILIELMHKLRSHYRIAAKTS